MTHTALYVVGYFVGSPRPIVQSKNSDKAFIRVMNVNIISVPTCSSQQFDTN